jgi:hypothetical protein
MLRRSLSRPRFCEPDCVLRHRFQRMRLDLVRMRRRQRQEQLGSAPHLIFAQPVSNRSLWLAQELVQVMPQELPKFVHRCLECHQFVRSITVEQRRGEFRRLRCRAFIQLVTDEVEFFRNLSNSCQRRIHKTPLFACAHSRKNIPTPPQVPQSGDPNLRYRRGAVRIANSR